MLTLCKSTYRPSDRPGLAQVPITARGNRTERWQGIQHSELANGIIEAVESLFDLHPIREQYIVSPNGACMIGGFDLGTMQSNGNVLPMAIPNSDNAAGASVGFVHSNDSRIALNVVAGGRVFICENGLVSGTTKFTRKHTSGLNLREWLINGLEKFWDNLVNGAKKLFDLKSVGVTDNMHTRLLITCARRGVIPWRLCKSLDMLWCRATAAGIGLQSHDQVGWVPEESADKWDFQRSRWDWYNAISHVIKQVSPARQYQSLQRATTIIQTVGV